ncbi:MAG: PaREP1 family protein [Promethearchaeia archaeon]
MVLNDKIKNARNLYDLALKELEESKNNPKKLRDAAEKAWGATASAVEALIEAKTGEKIIKGKNRSRRLIELAEDRKIPDHIQARYFSREDTLHGDCFYNGICEPRDRIERRIRETKDLIDDIEKLIKKTLK